MPWKTSFQQVLLIPILLCDKRGILNPPRYIGPLM